MFVLTDRDMGARHRARAHSIQIIRVEEIPASKCRRPHIKQFLVSLFLYFKFDRKSESLIIQHFLIQKHFIAGILT